MLRCSWEYSILPWGTDRSSYTQSDFGGQPEWGVHSQKYTQSHHVPWDTPTGWWSQRHDSVAETLGDTESWSPTAKLKDSKAHGHPGTQGTPMYPTHSTALPWNLLFEASSRPHTCRPGPGARPRTGRQGLCGWAPGCLGLPCCSWLPLILACSSTPVGPSPAPLAQDSFSPAA